MTGYAAQVTAITTLRAEVLSADDIGVFAVELALAGWEVFPLRGKVPAIANPHPRGGIERQECKGECGRFGHGVYDASSDLDKITYWWGRYPGANIGGRVPINTFVLDVDPRHGGDESLAKLQATWGDLPDTLTAISGRGDGGCHRFFRRPTGRISKKRLGPGIDLLDRGNYTVLPPSIHPETERPYRWAATGVGPSDPSQWLIDLIRVPPRISTPRNGARSANSGGLRSPFMGSIAERCGAANTFAQILEPHGWFCLDPEGDADDARWLHPAATSACSATIRHGCLFVYSGSTAFEQTQSGEAHGYTKFRAYAVLNHRGDLSAAARQLRRQAS